MRTMIALVAAFCVSAAAGAADNDRPTGTNCDLAAPPPSAGEEFNHGLTLKIFPRARDIGPGYTGCQLVWIPHEGRWITMSAVAIEGGQPVRIWAPEVAKPDFLDCRYKSGRIVAGDPGKCPMARFLLMRSMGPGCVDIVRKAVAAKGLGAPRPAECEYE